jgi:hypothetical protein
MNPGTFSTYKKKYGKDDTDSNSGEEKFVSNPLKSEIRLNNI